MYQQQAIIPSYMTDKDVHDRAVVKINSVTTETFGITSHHGLQSAAMGSRNQSKRCEQCRNFPTQCFGHDGEIETPMRANFSQMGVVINLLNVTCTECHKFKIMGDSLKSIKAKTDSKTIQNELYYSGDSSRDKILSNANIRIYLYTFIENLAKTSRKPNCYYCNTLMPTYKVHPTGGAITRTSQSTSLEKSDGVEVLTSSEMKKCVSSMHMAIESLVKEYHMYLPPTYAGHFHGIINTLFSTCMTVLPNIYRPEIYSHSSGRFSIHQYTTGYSKVLSAVADLNKAETQHNFLKNQNLSANIPSLIEGLTHKGLKEIVSGNQESPNSSSLYIGSFLDMGKKTGRIRSTVTAGVYNNAGRGVVTNNSKIHPSKVMCGVEFAMGFALKQMVTEFNIELLRGCVKNGSKVWPGAHKAFIGKRLYNLTTSGNDELAESLAIGDYVLRHAITGDIIMGNRPPTLMTSNFKCFYLIVNNQRSTDYAGVSMCDSVLREGYSGDSDGDALIFKLADTPGQMSDMMYLLSTEVVGRSEKDENNISGPTNNAVLSALFGTLMKDLITKEQASNIISSSAISAENKIEYMRRLYEDNPDEMVNYRDVISVVFPRTLNYDCPSTYEMLDKLKPLTKGESFTLKIRSGRIVGGVLDNNSLGTRSLASIMETMFGITSTSDNIDLSHDSKQINYGIIDKVIGFSISPKLMDIDKSNLKLLKLTDQFQRLRATQILEMHYMLAPKETGVREGTTPVPHVLIMSNTVMKNTIPIVLNGMKQGTINPLLINDIALRQKIDGLVNLASIAGPVVVKNSLVPNTIPGRISAWVPCNSSDVVHLGYAHTGPREGYGITEYIPTVMKSNHDIYLRSAVTAAPGFMRRIQDLAVIPTVTNGLGMIGIGSMSDDEYRLISYRYGQSNVAPHRHKNVSFTQLIEEDPMVLREKFSLDKTGEMWERFVDLYEPFIRGIENFSKVAHHNSTCYKNARLAIRVPNILQNTKKTPGGDSKRLERNVKLVLKLDEVLVNHSMVNNKWIKENGREFTDYPSLLLEVTRYTRLHVLYYLNPQELSMYETEDIDWVCQNIFDCVYTSYVNSGTAAGSLAIMSITEPITQKVLDAPKNKTVTVKESEQYTEMTYKKVKPNGDNTPVTAHVTIKEEAYGEYPGNDASHLVEIRLSNVKVKYESLNGFSSKVVRLIPKPILEFLATQYNKYIVIEYTINILALNKAKLTPQMLCGIMQVQLQGAPVFEASRTTSQSTIVIVMDFNINELKISDINHLVSKFVDSITIHGIKGMHSADIIENEVHVRNASGKMVAVKKKVLEVKVKNIHPIRRVPGADLRTITFDNPMMHAEYFGNMAAKMVLSHGIMSIFPSHNATTGITLSSIICNRGSPITLIAHNTKHLWDMPFVSATTQNAKENLMKLPQRVKEISVDDFISSSFAGRVPDHGSNRAIVQFVRN